MVNKNKLSQNKVFFMKKYALLFIQILIVYNHAVNCIF
jgi:hypothetical protein